VISIQPPFGKLLQRLQGSTVFVCGLVALILAACDRPAQSGDVVGSYRLNRGDAKDIIEIRADSSYVHSVEPSKGEPTSENGKWTLEDIGGARRVVFTNFLMRAPKEGQAETSQVRGIWPATLGQDVRGRTRLTVNDDLGWYYVREDPQSSE
jgi:hypothetical protein